jgi:hypothetical protein
MQAAQYTRRSRKQAARALRASFGVFCLIVGGAAVRARSEEPPAPADLAVRATSFRPPAAERSLDLVLDVLAGDVVVGEARIEARPAVIEGLAEPVWHVRETFRAGEGEDGVHTRLKAWLGRDLEPLHGEMGEGHGPDPLVHAFRRAQDAYEVKITGDRREGRSKRAERPGHALVGVTPFVLLAHEVAARKGTYTARAFAPDWEYLVAERPFTTLRIEAGPGRWRGRDVLRLHVSAPSDDRQLTVVLDPTSKALLYLHLQPPDAPAFYLRPRQDAERVEEDLDQPARTPRAAAMRTTLAFVTADAALFEQVVHWGRLRENGQAYVRGKVTPEAFRKAILGQFRRNAPTPMPADQARRTIRSARDRFGLAMEGERRAVVTLPPSISPMRVTVERIDEVWYLVKLPQP